MGSRTIRLRCASALLAVCPFPAGNAQDFADSSPAFFGCSVTGCRDLAKPGRSFLVVGSPMPSRALIRAEALDEPARVVLEEYRGIVWIFESGSSVPIRCISGLRYGDRLGQVVGSLPDLDGDGVEEAFACADTIDRERGYLLVFSPATGRTILVIPTPLPQGHASLSACRLDGPAGAWRIALGAPLGFQEPRGRCTVSIVGREGLLLVIPSLSVADRFGHCIASCGDLDGDGVGDLAIGAPLATVEGIGPGVGAVHIVSGAHGKHLRELRGESPGERFGYSISSLGNRDQDGQRELAVGAPGHGRGQGMYGAVRVFRSLDGHELAEWTPWWGGFDEDLTGDPLSVRFGAAIVDPGDLDRDGCGDLVVAAVPTIEYRRWGKPDRRWGHALLASSRESGPLTAERFQFEDDDYFASPTTGHLRRALSMTRVPDQNSDGLDDVIVGDAYGCWMKGRLRLLLTEPRELLQEAIEFEEDAAWVPLIGK